MLAPAPAPGAAAEVEVDPLGGGVCFASLDATTACAICSEIGAGLRTWNTTGRVAATAIDSATPEADDAEDGAGVDEREAAVFVWATAPGVGVLLL